MITRLRGTAWHEPCPVLHPFWWVCLPIIASHSIWWSGKGIPVIASHTNRVVDMQLVSCCIDRNDAVLSYPLWKRGRWRLQKCVSCLHLGLRKAVSHRVNGSSPHRWHAAQYFLRRAVAQHLYGLCILRHTLVPRSCAEEYALGPILSRRIQTVSHILFADECNELAPYLDATSAEKLKKMSTFYGTRTFINPYRTNVENRVSS